MATSTNITDGLSYRQVAEALAAAHRRADPDIVKLYLALDPSQREVRLVEITTEAPTTMEVLPVRFRATPEVPLPSAVLLLSPDEWAAIKRDKIALPDGWKGLEEI